MSLLTAPAGAGGRATLQVTGGGAPLIGASKWPLLFLLFGLVAAFIVPGVMKAQLIGIAFTVVFAFVAAIIVYVLGVKEIACQLSLSDKTVFTYRERIREKLGLRSDVELARYALERGLVE